jgi:hypothetical protein
MLLNKEIFFQGEVILVYFHNEPAFFARVESVLPDRKKGWWKMTFLVLTVPLQKMTWILDDEQMRGADFTMGGNPVRIEGVEAPEEKIDQGTETPKEENPGRVVSMFGEEE